MSSNTWRNPKENSEYIFIAKLTLKNGKIALKNFSYTKLPSRRRVSLGGRNRVLLVRKKKRKEMS